MTIIVLTTSCSPLAPPTGRSSPSSSNYAHPNDFLAPDNEVHNRVNAFSAGSFSSLTQNSIRRSTAETAPGTDVAASETQITSLPLQCDVTVLPAKARHLSSLDHEHIQAAFVVNTEILHPCGTDNVMIVQSETEDDDRPSHFSLSLTNCWAIPSEENSTLLPVDAVPSTFRFPLRDDGRDLMRGLKRNGYHSTSSRNGNNYLEGHVSFDFTAAWDVYRKHILADSVEKSRMNELKDESEYLIPDATVLNEAMECLARNSILTEDNASANTSQVDSIMMNLDQETRFLKQAIVVLSCFGTFIIIAILLTGWHIIQESRRDKKNDRQRVRIVDTLPREIRMSSRCQRQRNVKRDVTPELTPCNSTGAERPEVTERCHDQTSPENIYFVSLVRDTDTPVLDQRVKNTSDESLRPWYEDCLYPRIDLEQDSVEHESSIDTAGRDKTARSLFTPETPEHSANALEGDKSTENADQQVLENDSSVSTSSVQEFISRQEVPASQGDHHTTKNIMTKVKSQFSTPTSSVNIIELADHIETSSTPFPRQITASALVNPDDIKRMAERIRDPDASPFRPPTKIVSLVDSFLIAESEGGCLDSTDDGSKLSAIFEEAQDTTDHRNVSSNFISQHAVFSLANSYLRIDERAVRDNANSFRDSMSSASLLVSLADSDSKDGDRDGIVNDRVEQKLDDIDSMSSDSFLLSRDDDGSEGDGESTEDETQRNLDECKLDVYNEPDPIDEAKEMSAHDMKHNMIQELKESSRFKFKKTGVIAAPNFAEELAVVTGNKAARFLPGNDDFASSLAKRVAKKEMYKKPAKKTERTALTPIVTLTSSPAEQSMGTDSNQVFSDYL